jgi:hypothetical protein
VLFILVFDFKERLWREPACKFGANESNFAEQLRNLKIGSQMKLIFMTLFAAALSKDEPVEDYCKVFEADLPVAS